MNKILLATLGACAVGCAHYPAPTEQLAKSLAAVRGAEEAGAADVPQAALHVKLAQEDIKKAHQLMQDEKNRSAEDKALRAGNDAELAVAIAHEQTAKSQLAQFDQAHDTAGDQGQPMQTTQGEAR